MFGLKITQFTAKVLFDFLFFLQKDDVPAQLHGSVSVDEGRGIALVLGIGTETGEEVGHDLLTEGVQGV